MSLSKNIFVLLGFFSLISADTSNKATTSDVISSSGAPSVKSQTVNPTATTISKDSDKLSSTKGSSFSIHPTTNDPATSTTSMATTTTPIKSSITTTRSSTTTSCPPTSHERHFDFLSFFGGLLATLKERYFPVSVEEAELKRISLVDSTHRIRWEVTKEEFDSCEFPRKIGSPLHVIDIDGKQSGWYLYMYPKGDDEDDENHAMLYLEIDDFLDEGLKYNVRFQFGIETPTGCWPYADHVEELYSRGKFKNAFLFGSTEGKDKEIGKLWGRKLCTTEEFQEHFVENKVIVVATFVIYGEGEGYRDHMEIADEFVDDMRSAASLASLSDFTIMSGNIPFPCHKVLLAARSKYFQELFQNEPTKKLLKVDETPGLVNTMLNFISNGVIPENIHVEAMNLIQLSDTYGLDLLTVACEKSLVNNLTLENAVKTLIIIDKLKHISKQEHRQMVLSYIKKEAAHIVKNNDWKKFVQNYPHLITEILLLNS